MAAKSVAASAAAAGFRVFLMPIDCLKTTLQVEGAGGMKLLKNKIATNGPLVLFHGWEVRNHAAFIRIAFHTSLVQRHTPRDF